MKLYICIALITLAVYATADVSHLTRAYLPPARTTTFSSESGYTTGALNAASAGNGFVTSGSGFGVTGTSSGLSGKLIAAAPAPVQFAQQQSYTSPLRTYASAPVTQSVAQSGFAAPSAQYIAPGTSTATFSAPLRQYASAPVTQTFSSGFSAPSANYLAPVVAAQLPVSVPQVSTTYSAPTFGNLKSYGAPAITQSYVAPASNVGSFKSYSTPSFTQSYAAPALAKFTASPAAQNLVAPLNSAAPSFSSFTAPATSFSASSGPSSGKYTAPAVTRTYLAPEVETFAPIVQKTYSGPAAAAAYSTPGGASFVSSGGDTKYATNGGYVY